MGASHSTNSSAGLHFRKMSRANETALTTTSRAIPKFPKIYYSAGINFPFDFHTGKSKFSVLISEILTISDCLELPGSFLNKPFATLSKVPEFLVEWKANILSVSYFIHCRNCTETGPINNGQNMPSSHLWKLGFFEFYHMIVSPLVV